MKITGTWISSGWAGSPNAVWISTNPKPSASTAATATIVSQGGREVARVETEAVAMHGHSHFAINADDLPATVGFYERLRLELREAYPGFFRSTSAGEAIAAVQARRALLEFHQRLRVHVRGRRRGRRGRGGIGGGTS